MKKNLYTILFMLLATSGIKGMHEAIPVEGARPKLESNNAKPNLDLASFYKQTGENASIAAKQGIEAAKINTQRATMSGRAAEVTGYQSAIHPEGWTFTGVGQAAARPFVATGEAIYKAPGKASYTIGGDAYKEPMTSTATAVYQGGKAAGQAIGSGLSAVGSGAMAAGRMGIEAAGNVGKGAFDATVATGNAIGSAARTVTAYGTKIEPSQLFINKETMTSLPEMFKKMNNANESTTYIYRGDTPSTDIINGAKINPGDRITVTKDGTVYLTEATYSNLATRKMSDVTRGARQDLQSAGSATAEAISSGVNALGSGAKNLANKAYNAFDITAQEKPFTEDAISKIKQLEDNAKSKTIKVVENGDGTKTYTAFDGLYRVNKTTGEVFFTPRTWTGTPARNIKYYLNQLPSLKTVKSRLKFTKETSNELLKNNDIQQKNLTPEETQQLSALTDKASQDLQSNMTESQFNSWWNNLSNGIRNLFSRKSSANEMVTQTENNNWKNSDLKNDLVYNSKSSSESSLNNNSYWMNADNENVI
ncbi:MAG: hypothetical protein ACXWL5_01560 [Candidatus Chromulinivorax sp.]